MRFRSTTPPPNSTPRGFVRGAATQPVKVAQPQDASGNEGNQPTTNKGSTFNKNGGDTFVEANMEF